MSQTVEISKTSLVQQTPFEKLAASLVEKQSKSDLEITRKRQIIREIISIYCFMKKQFGIKHQPLDLEKFEVIRKQLYKTACEEIEIHKRKWWWFGLKPLRIIRWECFLRFGYFDPISDPSLITHHDILYSDLDDIFKRTFIHPSWDVAPPNIEDLTLALFKERFGGENE